MEYDVLIVGGGPAGKSIDGMKGFKFLIHDDDIECDRTCECHKIEAIVLGKRHRHLCLPARKRLLRGRPHPIRERV